MNRRPVQISLRILLLAILVIALVAYWFRPRPVRIEYQVVRIYERVNVPGDPPCFNAEIRVTKVSPESVCYEGLSPNGPRFTTVLWYSKGERALSIYKGSPATWYRLRRGESLVLVAPFNKDAANGQVSVPFHGNRWAPAAETWSEPFPLDASAE